MSEERRTTYVYFLAAPDRARIKIGCSYQPSKRLEVLRREAKAPLELLVAVEGNMLDERAIHNRFIAYQAKGEWFHGVPPLLDFIAILKDRGTLPEEYKGVEGQPRLTTAALRSSPEYRAKLKIAIRAAIARRDAQYKASWPTPSLTHGEAR